MSKLDELWHETGGALEFSIRWESTTSAVLPSTGHGAYVATLLVRSASGDPIWEMDWKYRDVEPFSVALESAAASILAKIKPCPKCKQKHAQEKKCRPAPALSVATPMVTEGEIKELADWCEDTISVRIEEAVTAFLKRNGIRVVTDAQADALGEDVEKGGGG